ncbi:MAG: alpha-amylase family glycosyl hydrolase [bacterium]|nr:alpha-amylase family glycosyl hydrolase [bacterium]
MKKRLLCMALIAALMTGLLGACGKTDGQNAGTDGSGSAQTNGETGADGSESGEPGNTDAESGSGDAADQIVYEYEQELNIIDDNYRNYYEIFVYSFYDSDGDGIGDLNGVTEKLDYIADMGFNGIWLMPIMPSTTYHKYDTKNYYEIDPEYGTMEDFERLVDECHKRGIRLIIDMVMNHSSSQHPWFLDACAYLRGLPDGAEPDPAECPSVEYYHFSKERVNGDYYDIRGCDWYYEGVFWSEMPDLNLSSEGLRREFEDVAKFWIDKGVDGFRMDAALHFEESDTTFNTETLNWLYSYCKGLNPDFYMVSEVWAGISTIQSYYASGTPSMFNFDAAEAEGKLIRAARGNYAASRLVNDMVHYDELFREENPDYIDAPFLTNHDMNRVSNALLSNPDDLKMACGLLMMMNGSPFVYYGEEIGMKSSGTKDENKRLPMIWSDTGAAGMTNGPRDADAGITSAFPGVEQQLADETSLLHYYKRALRLRNENPEIARGAIAVVESLCDGSQAAITKTYEGSTIGIVYNNSKEEIQVTLTGTELVDMQIRGYLTLNGEVITLTDGVLMMPAQSICILK